MLKNSLTTLLFLASLSAFADNPRELSLSDHNKINITEALTGFVENLSAQDKTVEQRYTKLISKKGEDDTYGVGPYQVTEWKILSTTDNMDENKDIATLSSEKIYLVSRILYNSSPGQYTADQHLIYKIKVAEVEHRKRQDEQHYLMMDDSLTITFEKLMKVSSSIIN